MRKDIPGRRHRLGIYGGTFAPPHNGHLHAAGAFLAAAELDTLLIMPAALPPHKRIDPGDDPQLRLAMTRAAFDGTDSRIRVSDFEIARGGTSYTWQTLTHFSETTDSELFLLCGTDMFLSLHQWRCPEIIFKLATVACIMREDDPAAYAAVRETESMFRTQFGARTLIVPDLPLPLSSTEIRALVRDGGAITDFVPESVARLIERHGLYRK